MDELEQKFVAYLEGQVKERPTAEVTLASLRDYLVPLLVTERYKVSDISRDISALVQEYRHSRNALVRIGYGRYLYKRDGFAAAVPEIERAVALAPPPDARGPQLFQDPFALQRLFEGELSAFVDVKSLARSHQFLVDRSFVETDFTELEGLSF